jgi:hypothetical protein
LVWFALSSKYTKRRPVHAQACERTRSSHLPLTTAGVCRERSTLFQPVVWHTDRALIDGTGCDLGVDTFAIVSGQDISIVFRNLQVDLTRKGGSRETAGRAQCSVRIPIDIKTGAYPSQIRQTIALGVTKSDDADVSAAANGTFFNVPTSSPQIRAASGWGTSLYEARLLASTHDSISPDRFCANVNRGATSPGLFRANIGVSAQRESTFDDAIIGAGPMGARYDIETFWSTCP